MELKLVEVFFKWVIIKSNSNIVITEMLGVILTTTMKVFTVILGLFICGLLNSQNYGIKVSDKFVSEIKAYNYKTNPQDIIAEYYKYLFPDSILECSKNGILTPIEINLDSDSENEIVSIFGWDETKTNFGVFKKINNIWYLVYAEDINMFYTPPELSFINTPSKNKTFYLRQLHERGSGVYFDSYQFYKLINNKVYHCLSLVNNARIYGWGLYLNQDITMDFKPSSGLYDDLWVSYKFNFFPGAVNDSDVSWDSHPELSFVKGEEGLSYIWDSINHIYQPQFCKYDKKCLNDNKVKCFGDFGNDSLFISAYGYELEQKLNKGTDLEKKLISDYINQVKQSGKSISPNGELEEKAKIGGTKFYGLKKQKNKTTPNK
ncbi:MAG: hypothetical protein Q8910_16230 [Bacteroidota bacterium]|nr:hypothetical protein [Bacteroidota bacterium]